METWAKVIVVIVIVGVVGSIIVGAIGLIHHFKHTDPITKINGGVKLFFWMNLLVEWI